ncbi:MAG: hypothetical protein ACK4V6_16960 [Microthrixaceae bacterium]
MDTPTASRSSRPALRVALVAVIATLAMAGCSSSDSTSSGSDTTVPASEEAATNDVATSADVSITLDFEPAELDELLGTGSRVMVAREVTTGAGGEPTQLVWLSLRDLQETTSITYDPAAMQVFASNTELEPGATVDETAATNVSEGETATWNDGTFAVTSGQSGSVTVMDSSSVGTVVGLAGSASVDGSSISAPYAAADLFGNEAVEFTDTGRILIWVSNEPFNGGTVLEPVPPSNATTVDVGSQPNARLTYNAPTQTFVLAT